MAAESGNWKRVDQVFSEALRRAPEERRAFLDRALPDEPSLRAQVEDLLARDAILEGSAADAFVLSMGLPDRVMAPETSGMLGPYKLTGILGQGGMGVVYRAEQSEPVDRVVAVKVVRKGLESADLLARFEGEQQALALMSHPNVATIFRTGRTDDGRPYLVMEYVPGTDLATHCDRERLTLRERIRLFLRVCDGVQHAHQKGIIHRDLKPTNILVKTPPGEEPTPKVIDFGIAKSLIGKLTTRAADTRAGVFVGTLAYSSPEQITGRYAAVDTRSDIYSLGAVLYELLAGAPPRSREELERSQFELARLLESSETPPLSTRFTELAECEEIAARRGASVPEVRKTLSGDLSWIIRRCLERDPDERYPSAQGLRSDLERWLDGRPVEAVRSSGFYRARKFINRYRREVALGAAVVVAILSASVAAAAAFIQARRASEELRVVADEARLAAEEVKLAADFQTKVLRSFDPRRIGQGLRSRLVQTVGAEISRTASGPEHAKTQAAQFEARLRAVNFTDLQLEELETSVFGPAERSIDEDYSAHPLLQAALWQSLADTLAELGLLEAAKSSQEKALSSRERHLPPDHELILASLESRSTLRALTWDAAGELSDTTRLLEARSRLGNIEHIARVLDEKHSFALLRNYRLDEALRAQREALRLWTTLQGDQGPDVLRARANLGTMLGRAGRLEEAELHLRQSIAASHRSDASEPDLLWSWHRQLARILALRGSSAEAEALVRSTLETISRYRGSEHFSAAMTRYVLGEVLEEREEFSAEAAVFDELVQYFEARDVNPAFELMRLGRAWLRLEELTKAEQTLERALIASSTLEPPAHAQRVRALASVERAELLRRQGRYAEALSTGRSALDDMKALHVPANITATAHLPIARTLLHMGHFEQAERRLQLAWSELTKVPGGERPRIMRDAATDFVALYMRWQRNVPSVEKADERELWSSRAEELALQMARGRSHRH